MWFLYYIGINYVEKFEINIYCWGWNVESEIDERVKSECIKGICC